MCIVQFSGKRSNCEKVGDTLSAQDQILCYVNLRVSEGCILDGKKDALCMLISKKKRPISSK